MSSHRGDFIAKPECVFIPEVSFGKREIWVVGKVLVSNANKLAVMFGIAIIQPTQEIIEVYDYIRLVRFYFLIKGFEGFFESWISFQIGKKCRPDFDRFIASVSNEIGAFHSIDRATFKFLIKKIGNLSSGAFAYQYLTYRMAILFQ